MQGEYEELCRKKKEIDEKLADWNEQTIEELLNAFRTEGCLKELVAKDNQLTKLKCLCVLWMDERIKFSKLGMESTALYEIKSLKEAEQRFLMLQFGMLRLECHMSQKKCEEVIDYIIRYRVSGIVLNFMIKCTTENYLENVKRLAKLLSEKKQYMTAACLLWEAGVDFESL